MHSVWWGCYSLSEFGFLMKELKLLLKISALKVKEVENYVSLKDKWNKAETVENSYLGLDVPEIIINWFKKK